MEQEFRQFFARNFNNNDANLFAGARLLSLAFSIDIQQNVS
jgi:hypothetical protein